MSQFGNVVTDSIKTIVSILYDNQGTHPIYPTDFFLVWNGQNPMASDVGSVLPFTFLQKGADLFCQPHGCTRTVVDFFFPPPNPPAGTAFKGHYRSDTVQATVMGSIQPGDTPINLQPFTQTNTVTIQVPIFE
jgi:hypothetical protein